MTASTTLTVSPTNDPRRVRSHDGAMLDVPSNWTLLPPGDAGLTRRVKAAGATWTVVERKGRKTFSRGVWAPTQNIIMARDVLSQERADPAYERRLASAARKRERDQSTYAEDFTGSCREFLAFSPNFKVLQDALAAAVAKHATPVGSGTVARTKRIPIEERAEAAVIAWLRHQTTAYDSLNVPRIKGARRELRRELAQISRALLDLHRTGRSHERTSCPLCAVLP